MLTRKPPLIGVMCLFAACNTESLTIPGSTPNGIESTGSVIAAGSVFQDDFAGPDAPTLGGAWQEANELTARTCCATTGQSVDPAWIERYQSALAFHYTATLARAADVFATTFTRPYAVAPLSGGVAAAPFSLSFTFEPSSDMRMAHTVGLMSGASGLTYSPSLAALERVARPKDGIAVTVGRSSHQFVNTTIAVSQFRGGAELLLVNVPTTFQFVTGTTYSVRMTSSVTGTIEVTIEDPSDAVTTSVQARLPLPPLDHIFVGDQEGGVSYDTSTPGDYRVLFDDLSVKSGDQMRFLQFPLKDGAGSYGDPYDWSISAVFDHSMRGGATFCPDDRVVAFTGEVGQFNGSGSFAQGDPRRFKASAASFSSRSKCPGKFVQGWQNDAASPTAFVITGRGNYSGGCVGCETVLYYDGHPGFDFRARYAPVFAAASGTVSMIVPKVGRVDIDHGNGFTTQYVHLSDWSRVYEGKRVSMGAQIGISGNTGTGCAAAAPCPHLHFAVLENGIPVDPYGWEPITGATVTTDPYPLLNPGVAMRRLWR